MALPNLVLIEGFDWMATADLVKVFAFNTASINTNTTHTPFNTGRSVDSNGTTSIFALPASTANLIVGLYYKNRTASTFNGTLLQFKQGNADQLCIKWQTGNTGKLEIRRGGSGGTLLDTTSSAVVTDGTFYHIEVKIKISTSIASGDVVIAVNGATVLTLAATSNTRATSTSSVDEIRFNNSDGGMYFDDVFVIDWSSGDTALRGKRRVYPLLLNGNGNASNFVGSDGNSTDNYALLNDSPISSTTYVGSASVNTIDTYSLANLSVTPVAIDGVMIGMTHLMTDNTSRYVAAVIRQGGTNYVHSTSTPASPAVYRYTASIWTSDPSTSAAWSASGVNNMEPGIKITA